MEMPIQYTHQVKTKEQKTFNINVSNTQVH
jgi:hypothetical protein